MVQWQYTVSGLIAQEEFAVRLVRIVAEDAALLPQEVVAAGRADHEMFQRVRLRVAAEAEGFAGRHQKGRVGLAVGSWQTVQLPMATGPWMNFPAGRGSWHLAQRSTSAIGMA